MKNYYVIILFLACPAIIRAQAIVQQIEKGNARYRKAEFQQALDAYGKILKSDGVNPYANFNAGNAVFRMKQFDKAGTYYQAAAGATNDPLVKAQSYYNQGVSLVKQNKLPEAVEAFKKSLRFNANDNDVRENLQKALKEMQRQKQEKEQQSRQKNPNDKNQPKKPQSPYSQDVMDRKLAELANEERKLQKQLQQKGQPNRQLKDW